MTEKPTDVWSEDLLSKLPNQKFADSVRKVGFAETFRQFCEGLKAIDEGIEKKAMEGVKKACGGCEHEVLEYKDYARINLFITCRWCKRNPEFNDNYKPKT